MNNQAVLVGQFAKVGDLADGSIRISIDVPKECWDDFGKIYSRGAGCVIARLENVPIKHKEAQVEQELEDKIYQENDACNVEAKTRGPMCMQCIYMMQRPEFDEWFNYKYASIVLRNNGDIEKSVKQLLSIKSRKELDTNKIALELFQNLKSEFMKSIVNA